MHYVTILGVRWRRCIAAEVTGIAVSSVAEGCKVLESRRERAVTVTANLPHADCGRLWGSSGVCECLCGSVGVLRGL